MSIFSCACWPSGHFRKVSIRVFCPFLHWIIWFSGVEFGYPRDTGVLMHRGTCTPMFIAALLTIAKVWKEPKCPSTDEWIKKMWLIYTMEYYLAMRKNEIMPFAATWMELEGIMLSERNQSEKDRYHTFSLICGS